MELQLWIWHRLTMELFFLSLPQVTSNLPDLGLHLGNSLSVHHGSILHIIDGLACELDESLKSGIGMDGFDGEPADEIQGSIEYGIGEELPLES